MPREGRADLDDLRTVIHVGDAVLRRAESAGRNGVSVSTACGFVTLRARELCAGLRWKFRRVLAGSCRPTVSCRLGRATAEREQPEDRGFCRWRHCADDLGRPVFAVPVADLGVRGHVRSVVCGCECRKSHPRHPTRRYSLIRPPTRECLRTRYCSRSTGSGFSGAAPCRQRCGRCWLWWLS